MDKLTTWLWLLVGRALSHGASRTQPNSQLPQDAANRRLGRKSSLAESVIRRITESATPSLL